MQTETYLEELTDVIPEAEAGTQTDELPARPPSPTFVPAKVGVDTTTQIEDGDLFDFDREVWLCWPICTVAMHACKTCLIPIMGIALLMGGCLAGVCRREAVGC